MSHFKPEDFPVLGETIKPSGENKKKKKDKQREQEIQDIVHEETSSKYHKECFVCGTKGIFLGENGHIRSVFMIRDCVRVDL